MSEAILAAKPSSAIDRETDRVISSLDSLDSTIAELGMRLTPIRTTTEQDHPEKNADVLLRDTGQSSLVTRIMDIHDRISRSRGQIVAILESLEI